MSAITGTDTIIISDSALAKVAELIAEEASGEELALRVAVRSRGCSGFSIEMFFDSELADDDQVTTLGGIRVMVDAVSAPMLTGATLDCKGGLQGAGFVIADPDANRTWGCGSSSI